MNLEQLITILNAGFTKDDVMKIFAPAPAPAPAQTGDVLNRTELENLRNEIAQIRQALQISNIHNIQQPPAEVKTGEDILASLVI